MLHLSILLCCDIKCGFKVRFQLHIQLHIQLLFNCLLFVISTILIRFFALYSTFALSFASRALHSVPCRIDQLAGASKGGHSVISIQCFRSFVETRCRGVLSHSRSPRSLNLGSLLVGVGSVRSELIIPKTDSNRFQSGNRAGRNRTRWGTLNRAMPMSYASF